MALLCASVTAQACSILDFEGPEENFRKNDTVLLAQQITTTREPLPDNRGQWPHDYLQHVTWEVVRVWKGPAQVGERFEQTSGIRENAWDCSGYNVVEAGQRVIFLSSQLPQLNRYHRAREETVGLLFDALAAGTLTP